MIEAAPTPLGRWWWQTFCRWSIRWMFHDFEIRCTEAPDPGKAILLIGNHISWWDGFWPIELNRRLWKREYYVMMLEDQLAPRPLMRRGGAFSIRPGHRSVVQTLRYAAGLLASPQNLVLVYPQGKIHSQYDRNFTFEPGVRKLIEITNAPFQVLFFAALLDYGAHPKPTLTMTLSPWKVEGDLEQAYRAFFESVERDHIAAQAAVHDPTLKG